MDKLVKYRELIKKLLQTHADLSNRAENPSPPTDVVFDDNTYHYMVCRVGWFKREKMRGIVLYVRLHEGKIWIEEDWTEDGLATELLAAGVPHADIVLAFHHPDVRPYTEFAVA